LASRLLNRPEQVHVATSTGRRCPLLRHHFAGPRGQERVSDLVGSGNCSGGWPSDFISLTRSSVGLARIEPATSALSGRSAESRSVPMCPLESQFRCSSGSLALGGETQRDWSGRAGTQLLGQSWDTSTALTRHNRELSKLRTRRLHTLLSSGRFMGVAASSPRRSLRVSSRDRRRRCAVRSER